MIMIKRPALRSTRRKSSNSFHFKNQFEKNNSENDSLKKIANLNLLEQKDSSKNLHAYQKSSKSTHNKSFKRMRTSKIFFNNKEEKNNKNYRIVKEVFDPKKYIISEEELFRQGEGYCFGEWALIYNQPRSASIYTLEDSVFFTLDEIHFKNSFLKSLNNSEYSKKKFALKNFLPFDMMNTRQLSIYKNIIPITCKQNQIVFNEGDISDSIYLVYLGSFTLEKKYGNKQLRVLNLERGSIIGLESIFEGEDSKYKCSLKLSSGHDIGLIFQLKINKLRPYIVNKMRNSFRLNYSVFLKSWNDLFCKKVFIQQKISNEKLEDIIGQEEIKDFLYYMNENEQIEFNGDLFNKNWNSVLNIDQEDKYEVMFKECLKTKLYDNHKKDGSLRIFSYKQKNKAYEYNNKNINIKKNRHLQNTNKTNGEKINSKSTNSLRTKTIKNVNEDWHNDIKYKTLNNINTNHNFNLTEKKKKSIVLDDEELKIDENLFRKEEYDKNNFINKKKNFILNHLKNNKKILFDTNIIKGNNHNNSEKNKYITIHFKDDPNQANKNPDAQKDNYIINKKILNFEQKKPTRFVKYTINNKLKIKAKEKNTSKLNILFNKINNSISLRESLNNKNALYRNNSFLQYKKNISIEKNSNININDISNKIIDKEINKSNISNKNLRSKLLKTRKIINDNIPNKNLSFINKKYSNIEQKHISPLNIKGNNLFISFHKEKINNRETIKNKRNNIFDKKKIYKIIKNCYSTKNKIIKNSIYIEDNKNNSKELNLKNGFSVSYREKTTHFKNIKNLEFTNKSNPFQSSLDSFKVSFDSGVFKIPLISSSVRLKKI